MRELLRRLQLVLLTLPLAVGCGGGGGGGGPTPPPSSLNWVAAGNPATAAFALRASESTATTLTLALEARTVDGLNALSCDVVFPAALRFEGFVTGDLLAGGGASQNVQVVESPAGRLVIGATRIGASGLAGAQGVVLSLRFSAAASGSGSVAFQEARAFDDRGGALGGVDWVGGTVTVVR